MASRANDASHQAPLSPKTPHRSSLKRKLRFFEGLYQTSDDEAGTENNVQAQPFAAGEETAQSLNGVQASIRQQDVEIDDQADIEDDVEAQLSAAGEEIPQSPDVGKASTQQPEVENDEQSWKAEKRTPLVLTSRPRPPPRPGQYTYSDVENVKRKTGIKAKREKEKKRKKKEKEKENEEKGKRKKMGNQKRKKKSELPLQPQILEGKKLFYYPPSIINVEARIRVKLAFEHGADVFRKWVDNAGITHIIVDKNFTYQNLLQYLNKASLPAGTEVVNERYFPDCIKWNCGSLRESRGIYRVEGFDNEATAIVVNAPETPSRLSAATSPGTTPRESPVSKRLKKARQEKAIDAFAQPQEPSPQAKAPIIEIINKVGHNVVEILRRREAEKTPDPLDTLVAAIQEIRQRPQLASEEKSDVEEEQRKLSTQNAVLASGNDEQTKDNAAKVAKQAPSWQDGFACMQANDRKASDNNPNAHTITILRQVASMYADDKDHPYHSKSYRQAATILGKQTELIASKQQAMALKSIGDSIAKDIEEFVTTGKLRRYHLAEADATQKLRKTFQGVYAVGPAQAAIWIAKGRQSLEDVMKNEELTENQKVGIEHYNDFQTPIPRAEVQEHETFVKEKASTLSPLLEIIIGGSYRRGRDQSGDVDFMITSSSLPPNVVSNLVFKELFPCLVRAGYLKHSLMRADTKSSKFMAAASLPGREGPWRRVDFLVVPWAELGAAVLYWTGDRIFNRSVRLLASKKGMRLNQHGLWKGVLRGPNREKITEGELLEAYDEKTIFELLGVPFVEPKDRNC